MTVPEVPKRWTRHRKEEVLFAIRRGELSVTRASIVYGVSVEELQSWDRAHTARGIDGLKATTVVR